MVLDISAELWRETRWRVWQRRMVGAAHFWDCAPSVSYRVGQHWRMLGSNVVDEIIRMFETIGSRSYYGEPLTIAAHSLQSARLAEESGADDRIVVAALLHDVGHLLHGKAQNIADAGIDGR